MATGGSGIPIRPLAQLFGSGTVAGLGDAQLLQRFLAQRDEAAFEALVSRHGPMVLAVCRRRLTDPNDVDDAFQATFLVLVRRARDIRDPSRLASWLYGVAHKVAERARVNARKRREHEARVTPMPVEPDRTSDFDDLVAPLLDEVRALPDRYRSPLVLCFLQGRTHEEAARELGWPLGSVKGRLARAKDLLRKRLVRRGVVVPSASVSAALAREAAGSVPPALIRSTVKAALAASAGEALAVSALSGSAAALAREVTQTMIRFPLKLILLGASALGLVGTGIGAYAWQEHEKPHKPNDPPAARETNRSPDDSPVARQTEATRTLLDAKSRLAQVRTEALLDRYKRERAMLFAYARMGAISKQQDFDPRAVLSEIKQVSDQPADQLAAAEALTETIETTKAQAQNLKPSNPTLIDFEVDLAESQVWLAELKARNPGLEPASWVAQVSKPSSPSEPAEEPEDPLDAEQNQAIREALEKDTALPFVTPSPLPFVVDFLRAATKSPELPEGAPIYLDPQVLDEAGITRDQEVTFPLISAPLHTSIQLILSQCNLTYKVHHGLLSIASRPYFVPESERVVGPTPGKTPPYDVTGGSDWSQAKGPIYRAFSPLYGLDDETPADRERSRKVQNALNQTITMSFPEETPLNAVLIFVCNSTVSEDLPHGLPIYVDPVSLEQNDKTLESPIIMDLSDVRLKTALDLTFKQLGLTSVVRQGVLIVLAPEMLETMPNPRDQSEFERLVPRFVGGMMMGGSGMGGGMMGGMGGGFMGAGFR